MSKEKTHKNLDELNEQEIIDIAKGLKIDLLDHKIPTLKTLIREKWKKKGIEELPIQGLTTQPKKMPQRKENYQFTRNFTEDELKLKSKQLSGACIQRNEIEDEFKSVKSGYKSRIEAEQAKINMLSGEMQRGHETVLKTCDVLYDYDKGVKIYTWEGKEVGRERMTKADYQTEAEFTE